MEHNNLLIVTYPRDMEHNNLSIVTYPRDMEHINLLIVTYPREMEHDNIWNKVNMKQIISLSESQVGHTILFFLIIYTQISKEKWTN